ncbi:MAG: undecaprenyl/decaprenyl-phosphate alpha-N-acetylglucosaminyl 1-phosphate transferase [Coriobacteriales bacterium]|nr:undecaprenyl/decaprenyl-phosphate alpha-N-acetylglucosaminyl 1-phosphate transferase [Coriobacteriales bacterium]
MDWFWFLSIALVAAALTYVLVPASMWVARRFNVIDYPDGRRVNTSPIPRLGGIALFFGVMGSVLAFSLADSLVGDQALLSDLSRNINYPGVLVAMTVIFGLGLLDDFIDLSALVKLVGQTAGACVAVFSGVLISRVGSPFFNFSFDLGMLAYPVTIFYLVAFANIFNLIDGLDGLAAGIVTISSFALLMLSLERSGYDAVVLSLALIGSCLAFLRFNFHPARVFMGDSGALFIGFTFGIISLLGAVRSSALISILVPVAIAGIPAIDTTAAIVRRVIKRQPIFVSDMEHVHHRLINIGFNQRATVLIIYSITALFALCAYLIVQVTGVQRILLSLFLITIAILLVWILGLPHSVLRHFYNRRGSTQAAKEPANGPHEDADEAKDADKDVLGAVELDEAEDAGKVENEDEDADRA